MNDAYVDDGMWWGPGPVAGQAAGPVAQGTPDLLLNDAPGRATLGPWADGMAFADAMDVVQRQLGTTSPIDAWGRPVTIQQRGGRSTLLLLVAAAAFLLVLTR